MADYGHYLPYFFSVLVFFAVVLLVEGAYIWWSDVKGPEAQRVERRLRMLTAGAHGDETSSILKERLLASSPAAHQLLLQIPRIHNLDRLLEQSGSSWSVARFVLVSLAFGGGTALVTSIFTVRFELAIVAGVFAMAMPFFSVLRKRKKRLERIEEQLPDALDLMSRALRAGHAFPSALKMVGDELAAPIAGEFAVAFDEVNYGKSMQEALTSLAERVPSQEMKYFVVAVLIQRTTGGNLSELLDQISAIMRARQKLLGTIRVLSADGRLSGVILCCLPFVLAGAIFVIHPDFLAVLWTDPAGSVVVSISLVLMVIGIFWMRQITRIRI